MSAIPQTDNLINIASQDERYELATLTQEIESILENIGFPKKRRSDITACLVIVGDGDYEKIWLSESSAPYLNSATYHNLAYYGL